ncbi:protein NPAT [Spea bombifrons]|uniref:protein NPAT n=1 Tax=Spea bombifrons TaxID=233779 RepID=UPI00234BB3F3|nr:protein NPAT [Spea bombifrons]
MLLPSDVARLVLGYLQQEKLTSTCQSFITESPDLKEYAEHFSEEGLVPGCVLSLFGKNLTTILNEYVAIKARENKDAVPLMMSSLWKKLDHTLSQIRSMQESVAFQTHQRSRTRNGIEEIRRQRMLLSPSTPALPRQQTSTPIAATQVVLRPASGQNASQASPSFGGQSTIQGRNSPLVVSNADTLQIISVAPFDRKQSSAVSSPLRRKNETRKRRGAVPSSSTAVMEGDTGEDSDAVQELINDNFPQLVIENAREKILSSKSLQEKLAENINKFLGSDSAAHNPKAPEGSAAEPDASIDEILGLQGGEIHMSEEAIHDILVQTELDPDFQELYDLFACVSKSIKNAPRDSSAQNEGTRSGNSAVEDSNLDTVESSFDTDDGSTSHTSNPDDAHSKQEISGKESSSKMITDHVTSSSANDRQECGNGRFTSSESSQIVRQSSINSVASLGSAESDTLKTTNQESQEHVTVTDIPDSSDVEMKNVSQTEETDAATCPSAKENLPSNTGAEDCQDQIQEHLVHGKEAQETNNLPIATHVDSQEEKNHNNIATEPSTTISPKASLLIPAKTTENKSPHQEEDKEKTITLFFVEEPSAVATDKPVHLDRSSTLISEEPTGQQKSGSTDDAQQQNLVPVTQLAAPAAQLPTSMPSSGSLPLSSPVTAVELAPNSSSQTATDPAHVVTLNVIAEDLTRDAELHNAISTITGENFPAIVMSPITNPTARSSIGYTQESSVEATAGLSVSVDPIPAASQFRYPSINAGNIQAEECSVFSVAGSSNPSSSGGLVQIMPVSSSSVGHPNNSVFISTCAMQTNTTKLSNVMLLPSTSAAAIQTPPRQNSVYTMGQNISPKLPQGSTIILASQVHPVLQGVVGMFPVSVVGQRGNSFAASPHQVLHVPISGGIVPKLPLPPNSQKPKAKRSAGKPVTAADSTNCIPSSQQRVDNPERKMTTEIQNQSEESLPVDPTSKVAESHRRVLRFDTSRKTLKPDSPSTSKSSPNKDKSDVTYVGSSAGVSASPKVTLSKDDKTSEKNVPATETAGKMDTVVAAQVLASASSKGQTAEKRAGAGTTSDVPPEVAANKENLLQVDSEKQELKVASTNEYSETNMQPGQDASKKKVCVPNILRRTPQKLLPERGTLTSSLTKQASDLLHEMQFHSPSAKQSCGGELPIPRTPGSGMDERSLDDHSVNIKTPTCKRSGEDGGTPKPMLPPATPDLPTCSPASEAGSENSVSMAAHTLMILSRANMAKSSGNTPLKDNTQQCKSSKNSSKKRKLDDPAEHDRHSPIKEIHSTTSTVKKKKVKKHRKKLFDTFPAGMDVDKFLMSLHYDE